MPARKWQVLALLFWIGAINYADRTAISAVFPLLRRDLGLTDVGLAAVGSLFLWSYGAASLGAGILADRLSRSRLIAASLAGWSAATLATGLVTDSSQLFGLRILLGLTECLYLPAALALIADYHGVESRAMAMGIHSSSLTFGMVAGGTVAGHLGASIGWRPLFFLLGGAGLLLSAFAAWWLRDASSQRSAESEPLGVTLRELARTPVCFVVFAEAALISISTWIFANWLPLYFRETHGLSLAAAGFSGTFAFTVGAATGSITGGWLSDRVARKNPRRRMLNMGLFYAAAAPFLLVFQGKHDAVVVGAAILLFGLVRGWGSSNEVPLMCDQLPPRRRSTAIGFMNAMNTSIGGLGVFASGYFMSRFPLSDVFLGLVGVVLLASAAALTGYWALWRGEWKADVRTS